MGTKNNANQDLLPGTLEMLILQTLKRGPNHGYGIAEHIGRVSEEFIRVGEGSLYPALQRLLINDWVEAEWGVSENNRKARFYRITAAGNRKLQDEKKSFDLMIAAIGRVMEAM